MAHLRRNFIRFLFIAIAFIALPSQAAHAKECAQPVSTGAAPVASDCLFILGAAVGSQTCSPECVCSPTGSLPAKATDALLCLKSATGQPVTLNCPCNDPPADAIIGTATADRGTSIIPPFFPGVPGIVNESFSLGGSFTKITGTPPDIDITQTVETFGVCTVTTIESTQVIDSGGPTYTITNYDPGNPGKADNGTVSADLERESAGGFDFFSPAGDPFALGFDGGQTVEFSWPGGTQINAFAGSVDVPQAVEITSPDLESAGLDVIPGQALPLTWVPGIDDDGKLSVHLATSISGTTPGPGSATTYHVQSVTIVCLFTDADGAGTIPAAATAGLLEAASPPEVYSKTFFATRQNTVEVDVNAPSVGGARTVVLSGSSSVTVVFVDFPF